MNVDILCPQCGTLFTVRRDLLGKRTKCIKCGTMFVIAEPPAGSAPRVAAPTTTPTAPAPPPLPSSLKASQMPAAELPEIVTTPRLAPIPPPPIDVHRPAPTAESFPPHEFAGAAAEVAAPRFTILYFVARVYEVLAILALVAAALLLLLSLAAVVMNPTATVLPTLMAMGLSVFWAMMAAVMFALMAQSIRLGLQIEQNTRETRLACERLAEHLSGIEHEP
jgi:hypothetical protein